MEIEVNCEGCLESKLKVGDSALQIYGQPLFGQKVYTSETVTVEKEWEGSYDAGQQHRGLLISSGKYLDACDLTTLNEIPEGVQISH